MVSISKNAVKTTKAAGVPAAQPQERRADDYIDMVKRVAYGMARRLPARVDVRDLIGAGTIGLLDAISKYNPEQNDNFEAYAEIRIRGSILDELRSLDWIPRSVRQKSHRLDRATRELEGELGRAPNDDELASRLDMSLDQYYKVVKDVSSVALLSLDEVVGNLSSGGGSSYDIPDYTGVEQISRRATATAVSEAIEQLPERERLVLSLYYLEDLKLREIGDVLDVTESRVCQVHGQAIKRLRGMLEDAI